MDTNIFFKELDRLFSEKDIKGAEAYMLDTVSDGYAESDLKIILAALNELGGFYRTAGRYTEALSAFERVSEVACAMGIEDTVNYGTILLNHATAAFESGEDQKAMELYSRAEGIFEANDFGKDYRMAALNNNISMLYQKCGDTENALKAVRKALQVLENYPQAIAEKATTYINYGSVYTKAKDYENAMKCLSEAEAIFNDNGLTEDVHYGAVLAALGELHYHTKEYDRAEEYYEKALSQIKMNFGETENYKKISRSLDLVREAAAQNSGR